MIKKIFNSAATYIIIIWLVCSALIVTWTQNNLSWLLSAIKGSPVEVGFIVSTIITVLLSPVVLTFNIIIELIKWIF